MATTTQPTLAEALADLPPRVRVHDLARRAGLNSKDTIAALAGAGVDVASASSAVDQDVAEALLTAVLGGAKPAKAASAKAAPAKAAQAASGRGRQSAAAKDGAGKDNAGTDSAGNADAPKKAGGKAPAVTADDVADVEASDKPARGARAAKAVLAKNAEPAKKAGTSKTAVTSKAAAGKGGSRKAAAQEDGAVDTAAADAPTTEVSGTEASADDAKPAGRSRSRRGGRGAHTEAAAESVETAEAAESGDEIAADSADGDEEHAGNGRSRRRRRGGRGRRGGRSEGGSAGDGDEVDDETESPASHGGSTEHAVIDESAENGSEDDDDDDDSDEGSSSRRRRRRRRRGGSSGGDADTDETPSSKHSASSGSSTVQGVKGSTRLEAKRQRRRDSRETRRRPQILSEAEFLARRESVDRVMAVRQHGDLTQVALLEDGILVEHFVSQQGNASMIGNVYVGRVQNVLPSMEAAFVDIGKGRNAVLYAGEVNWDIAGLEGKERRIETALASGDTVLVQVSKDPVGHKGARLTTQISLPGRFLVFVPDGGATGISRKLPDNERKRLKKVLDKIVPPEAGVIIRTAAEGVGEDELAADVERLRAQWEQISTDAQKAKDSGSAPKQLYSEPDTLIKVIRDLFNSDINRLLIDGDDAWTSLSEYVLAVAPELADRVSRYVGDKDVFAAFRIDEQIAKALQRKVRLPSGGSLVIDRTEAMTVVDVNTGKFTGSGGNLEETVTRNNLEAAEEIVRQLRLRDIGGIIVVDFIDMVLESNRDLVLRRLTECLGRDRTRHQVAEVTSLGLVQMTRKKMGLGLVEAFSEPCATCAGRGIVLHDSPAAIEEDFDAPADSGRGRKGRKRGRQHDDDGARFEPLVMERVAADAKPDPRGPRPPALFRTEDHEDAPVADEQAAVVVDADVEAVELVADEAVDEETAEAVVALAAAEPRGRSRGGRSRGGRGRSGAAASGADAGGGDDAAPAAVADAGAPEAAAAEAAVSEAVSPEAAPAKKSRGRSSSRSTAQRDADAMPEAPVKAAPTKTEKPAPAETTAPAAAPTRRRRAAGRPAGAPASAAQAVDLVLPKTGAAAD